MGPIRPLSEILGESPRTASLVRAIGPAWHPPLGQALGRLPGLRRHPERLPERLPDAPEAPPRSPR